jgi:putative spermidine/putrescine transport system permease protein
MPRSTDLAERAGAPTSVGTSTLRVRGRGVRANPTATPPSRPAAPPLWLLLPLLAALAVLLVWPLAILALRSIADADGGLTFGRYLDIMTDPRYLTSLRDTAVIAVLSTSLALVVCVPAAIYLERTSGPWARVLAVALTLPLSLPGIVIGFFVILVFGNTGVVPITIEQATGSRALQIAYTFAGLLLGYLYFQIPRVVLVVRGAVAGISDDAVDAARTLGASTWRIYREVVLPTLRPAVVNAASLALATAFGAFGTAATLSRGFSVMPLEIAAAFTERFRPEQAAALSVVLALITTTLILGLGRLSEVRR